MKQGSVVFEFPTESLQFTLAELLSRDTSGDSDLIKKIAAVCKWWCETNLPLEVTTSGSTGFPKKFLFERSAVHGSIELTAQAFGLKEGMTALLAIDPGFIGGRMMILRTIEIGLKLICLSPVANPILYVDQLVDFASMVPLQANSILSNVESVKKLGQIKTILIGGAPLSKSLRKKIELSHSNAYLGFGMTETLSHIALQKIAPDQEYFNVLPGISVGTDDRGCLFIDAPHVSSKRIQSNDLVQLKDEKHFRWTGRYDRVINSGGIKLSPEVMEEKAEGLIQTSGSVDGFFFCAVEDERLGQRVILLLIGNDQPEIDSIEKMLESLKHRLDRYEFPKAVYWTRQVAKNSGGKTDQRKTLEGAICIWPASA